MTSVLCILSRPEDPLAADLAARQRRDGATVEIFDLTAPEPDYGALLEKIFAADSVQCW